VGPPHQRCSPARPRAPSLTHAPPRQTHLLPCNRALGEHPAPPSARPCPSFALPCPRAHSARSAAPTVALPFQRHRRVCTVASTTMSFAGALRTGTSRWFSIRSNPLSGPHLTPPLRRPEFAAAAVSRHPVNRRPPCAVPSCPECRLWVRNLSHPSSALIPSHREEFGLARATPR
jgi:hypothetical protein